MGEGSTDLVLSSKGDVFVAHLPSLPEQKLLLLEVRCQVRLMTQTMIVADPLSVDWTPEGYLGVHVADRVVTGTCP